MKKRTRILILGVAMMLIMAMSGCGVNHKSPEGVVEALIKNYVSGSEKKVKQCYSQEKDTNELLQNEIDATLKYFAAHNPTKVKVEQCDILSENGDYTYVYIIYNLVLENDQEYPCVGTYMTEKKDGKYYVIIKAEPAWTQPQRLKHQQPSIHEYIKEISDTQVNQAVSEKDMESIYEQYGKYLIETKNPVLKEYLEKEITKKESIAAELKQSIKEIESEELSGKERGNIAKRQRGYQEIQKEIRDMRKAIG